MLSVGERLKIARERTGVSVNDMAAILDRHRNRVRSYEQGNDAPMWVLRKYAEHLPGVTLEWLAAETGDPPPQNWKYLSPAAA